VGFIPGEHCDIRIDLMVAPDCQAVLRTNRSLRWQTILAPTGAIRQIQALRNNRSQLRA
jgi:hypothetical protein